jgi:hypothetical protein
VRRADVSERWPLTVDSIRVECIGGLVAVGHYGGKTYALNGVAETRGFLPIDSIWLENPDDPGGRINISPVSRRAVEQCHL